MNKAASLPDMLELCKTSIDEVASLDQDQNEGEDFLQDDGFYMKFRCLTR